MTEQGDLIASVGLEGNIIQKQKATEKLLAGIERKEVTVDALDEMSTDLGVMLAGEFRTGNDCEPGDGFTGVRMGYPGFEYGDDTYNLVGVNSDVLQFGISATTGKVYAVGGNLVIDQSAMTMEGLMYALVHNATYGGVTRTMRYGMFLPSGSTTPAGIISFESPAGDELLDNNGFEDGDFTSWTTAGAGTWAVATASPTPATGTYEAKLTATQAQAADHTLTADAVAVTGDTVYQLSVKHNAYQGGACWTDNDASTIAEVKWYDAAAGGGSLVRTDTLALTPLAAAWKTQTASYTSPPTALSAVVVITLNRGVGVTIDGIMVLDDISLNALSVGTGISFEPGMTVHGSGVTLPELGTVPSTPSAGSVIVFADARGRFTLNSAGEEWPIQPEWSVAPLIWSNSAAETTIFTRTIPANSLGNVGRLIMHLHGHAQNNSGSARNFITKIKLGGTTLLSWTSPAIAASANDYPVDTHVEIVNTTTQLASIFCYWDLGVVAAINTLSAPSRNSAYYIWSQGSIDTTTAMDLVVTIQLSAAHASYGYWAIKGHMFGPYKHS